MPGQSGLPGLLLFNLVLSVVTAMVTVSAPAFDPLVAGGIGALAVVASLGLVVIARGTGSAVGRSVAGVLVGLLVGSAGLALAGVFARQSPLPGAMAVIVLVVAASLGLGLSPFGGQIARAVSLPALIGLQAFRLPLELVMHRASDLGIMPVQLTYTGLNFDIVTGSLALPVAVAASKWPERARSLVAVWNLIGLACLVMILFIAVAASPLVHRFGTGPGQVNTWILYFPYVWLPCVMVVIALTSHIWVTRRLLADKQSSVTDAS